MEFDYVARREEGTIVSTIAMGRATNEGGQPMRANPGIRNSKAETEKDRAVAEDQMALD
jgi:hypothetical protein